MTKQIPASGDKLACDANARLGRYFGKDRWPHVVGAAIAKALQKTDFT
ncbi:hypothetical protein [Neorhizobium petrolearium]